MVLSPETITEEFVKLVEHYRKRKGISQNKLAIKAGLTGGLLSRMKHGSRKIPAFDKVWYIACLLDMPLEEFISILESKEKEIENGEKQ